MNDLIKSARHPYPGLKKGYFDVSDIEKAVDKTLNGKMCADPVSDSMMTVFLGISQGRWAQLSSEIESPIIRGAYYWAEFVFSEMRRCLENKQNSYVQLFSDPNKYLYIEYREFTERPFR